MGTRTRDVGRGIHRDDFAHAQYGTRDHGCADAFRCADYADIDAPADAAGRTLLDPAKYADDFFGWIAFTFPFNATGQPALSVPNGFTKAGLPIGLQIVGRPADEPGIIALAAAWEEARPWAGRRPPLD